MEELILYKKMKAGDRSAFDKIFKLHYEQLVRFAHVKIDNISIAEDIVQNIFIDFWTKRASINIEKSLLPYLRRTVHNRCIDHFRKQKSIQKKEEQFFQNSLTLDISNPEQELLSQENLQAIYTKIEALSPKCKVVFKLSRFEEMTYAEIATHLNISKKTVEMHISTALRILRKSIFISLISIFF
ncbi:MAG: RNA polymerase sigma factor [Saprospiraceae bacterium]